MSFIKICIFIIGACLFFGFSNAFAACDSDSLASSGFCLDTGKMGPFPASGTTPANSVDSISIILKAISTILLYLIPILAAISGVIAGYYFVFSSGDSENTSRAKTIIKYNIMAIILALTSYSIILFVAQFFSN